MDTAPGSARPCPLCSRARSAADASALDWSSQHEADGSTTWICPTCTRAQLWRIEALLRVASPTAPAAPVPLRPAA